ncbi:hypothetical protein [Paenibacillus alginolyticus]|uniref:Uncharacterized protein n=2 Tax=Paenibacillus alginolyticus TaxID=59839 RepID=A0ABT4G574_9BACL|nr:hypothetical protein [Paenibacillus alginolyticus]MCY9691326.1 hypothetical protein [Paenibacillus alginolyticus]
MEIDKDLKRKLSEEYTKDFLELRIIVNKFDPLGLIRGGAPENEHDNVTQKLIRCLYDHKLENVRDLLIDCYDEYGFNGRDIKEEFLNSFNKKIEDTYNLIENWYLNKYKNRTLANGKR